MKERVEYQIGVAYRVDGLFYGRVVRSSDQAVMYESKGYNNRDSALNDAKEKADELRKGAP